MQDIIDWLLETAPLLAAIATIIGLLGGALKVVLAVGAKVPRRNREAPGDRERPNDVDELTWASRMLAKTTREQWQKEAIRLGLIAKEGSTRAVQAYSASLIRIAWTLDTGRMPMHSTASSNEVLERWRDNPGVDELPDFFHASPAKAMVVLGSPQAGKSAAAVLLTLGLLNRRKDDIDPIAVKFSLAQWDHGVSLEGWLTQRLLDDHAGFRNTETYGPDVVSKLLHSGLVLPILDGLDELPGRGDVSEEDERDRVIEAINGSDLPLPGLILTCQVEVYDDLDNRLREAVIVKLAGVPPSEAERYIRNASLETKHPERWEPVLESLHSGRKTALSKALESPLMVYLVPKVYKDPNSTPAELLAYADSDATAIEAHLLGAFVPAVFPDRSGQPWRSKEARRWLGHLAARMEEAGQGSSSSATRFGWWDLSRYGRPVTSIIAGVIGGGVGGAAVGSAFTALFNDLAGLVGGGVAALALGYLCGRNPSPKPSETQTRRDVRARSILKSGAAIGVVVFVGGALARDISLGLIAGVGFGIPIALLYGLTEPDPTLRPLDAGLLLRRDIKVGITFGITYGVPAGITGWFLTGDVVLSTFVGVAAGLAGALLYGPVWIFAALAPMGGARKRLEAIGVVAFVHLVIATVRFAPPGKLPWRVMAFLDRAHDLGVLRLVSGSYEFRHRALQRVLAAEYSGEPAPAAANPVATPAAVPPAVPSPKRRRRRPTA